MSGERVFKTYPTQAQLAEMDRDLEFHPTTNEHPRVLSREQVAHYNREGYITGLNALPAEEVSRTRTFVDELMATVMAKGAGSYSVKHAHMKYGAVVYNELRAGQCSIHSDLLLHGSEVNDSDRRRCGLTLRYCTPDVRGTLGWNNEGIIVSGRDPDNHWGNPPRPVRDYDGV